MKTKEVIKTPIEDVKVNRNRGLGGSDATRIMRGDWHDLWLEKTNRKEPDDLSQVLAVQLGIYTEPVNRMFLNYSSDLNINEMSVHNSNLPVSKEFMFAHYDDYSKSDNALVEYKHTNSNNTLDNCISTYMPQVQHYLMVSECNHLWLSVIFGNQRHEYCKIDSNKDYQKKLYDIEKSFWSYVQSDKEPEKIETDELPKLAGAILINDMITINFDENKDNQFLSNATRWVETKQIANENTALGKVLKAKIPDNCRKAVGGGVVISRTKAGYLTIKEETKGGMLDG